jgi:phage terminase small subunit
MARPKKPVTILEFEGDPGHRGKAELERQKTNEIGLGSKKKIKQPRELRGRKHAQQKWKWVVKLYDDSKLDIINFADEQLLARYCIMYEEYLDVIDQKDSYVIDIDTQVKYTNQLTKYADKLLKYEELLYLTPAARAKGLNKAVNEKPKSELEKQGFAV